MKRLAAILLPALLVAFTAAQASPGFVIVGQNGRKVLRLASVGPPIAAVEDIDDADASVSASTPPEKSGKLRWQNGETLPGEPAGASPSALLWRTPLFEEPLQLGWTALRRYDRPGDAQSVADPFAFVLRDGGHLYGTPVAITADAVAIHSTRHGDVRLRRSEVLSARRVSRDGLPAGGSSGDAGWRALTISDGSNNGARLEFATPSPLAAAPLVTGPGGTLELPYWNTAAFRETPLPDRVEVEFRVHAPKRPDFSLVLEPAPGDFLRVATWDDEVVLAGGDRFVRIGRLADKDREVAFRVFWDRPAGRCLVCTPEGAKVADWRTGTGDERTPAAASGAFPPAFPCGVALLNKGRALTLDLLRVRAWDGAPPAPAAPGKPGVWLADGRRVQGEIVGGSADEVRLDVGAADAASFPLDAVDAIVFPPGVMNVPCDPVVGLTWADGAFQFGLTAAPSHPLMTLTWADGTFLTGRMAGWSHGVASIDLRSAEAPLSAQVDGLRQLLLPPAVHGHGEAEPPLAERDKITAGDLTLHGDLSCLDDGQPHWLPVGGVKPAVPSRGLAYEIHRAHPAAAGEESVAPALFYAGAGDVLPGVLRSLDASGVDFDSGYVEAKKFQPGDLEAIEFNGNVPARIEGFSGPGWRIVGGDAARVERKDDGSLRLEPGGAIGHPWVMEGSELRFRLAGTEPAALRLRMFCAETDGSKAASLVFFRNGSSLIYGLESADGQMESQQNAVLPRETPAIRLVMTEESVEMFLGDKSLEVFPLPLARRAGDGLVIEPASLWGNPVQTVELSGFAAEFRPGHVGLPAVTAEARREALTVPRFRKDDPPRQALIAVNGDVLRGELTGATGTQFAFRSGLESLRVPRERVRAAVWLKPPAQGVPAPGGPGAVPPRLDRRCELNGQFANMRMRDYVTIILQYDPELKARFSGRLGDARLRLRFDQPTIGEALNQVCATFNVSYRLEGETLVFSAAGATPPDMTRQTCWLRPDAFSGEGTAQEALTAKGLSFPEGASARWEPAGRQLVMTNTAENQRRLADVLRADFGGSLGAPTHWLELTDGTRLGLAVDRFDRENITGHHPLYGRCQVPLAAVSAIRSSAPEPGAAARLFADWRLIAAPEPVLPGAGGQGDALAGRQPEDFTLPLLGGGEFELAGEKGKVVVLDFWATWSPPCLQSLPGLIEAMGAFPADRVRFVGVDQAEPAARVRRFLDARGWKLAVALDAAQDVGKQFGADSLPETVVIGPDGKTARVWTGDQPGREADVADTVKALLANPAKPPEKSATAPANPAKPPEKNATAPEVRLFSGDNRGRPEVGLARGNDYEGNFPLNAEFRLRLRAGGR